MKIKRQKWAVKDLYRKQFTHRSEQRRLFKDHDLYKLQAKIHDRIQLKALKRQVRRGPIDLDEPYEGHPDLQSSEMCGFCGEIYYHKRQDNHRNKHNKSRDPNEKWVLLPWGACPSRPFWVYNVPSGYTIGGISGPEAPIQDLCDPAPVTDYIFDMLENSVAVPPSF